MVDLVDRARQFCSIIVEGIIERFDSQSTHLPRLESFPHMFVVESDGAHQFGRAVLPILSCIDAKDHRCSTTLT